MKFTKMYTFNSNSHYVTNFDISIAKVAENTQIVFLKVLLWWAF
jgi:hypothetical protein